MGPCGIKWEGYFTNFTLERFCKPDFKSVEVKQKQIYVANVPKVAK